MRSNIFAAIVVLAATSMAAAVPVRRDGDLSTGLGLGGETWNVEAGYSKRADGGNASSGRTGNVNGGGVYNSGDTINNGAGSSKFLPQCKQELLSSL